MIVLIYMFKIVYILHKKLVSLKLSYLKLESKYLFPNRIIFPKNITLDQFPDLYFDSSSSQLILNENIGIRGKSSFLFNNNGIIKIGANTFLNNDCSINCLGEISIGENCLFGESVKLYDHNHIYTDKTINIRDQGFKIGKITIGNNCWIGSNTIILNNVVIGDNVIIGANNLIYKPIPSNSVIIAKSELNIKNYPS
jgi:acetyltransferase-like isoleucine patch superfamily enzyme